MEKDLPLRLAAFVISFGGDEAFAKELLEHLKCDNKTKNTVFLLINNFNRKAPKTKFDIKFILNKATKKDLLNIISLLYLFEKITREEKRELENFLKEIIENEECYNLKALNISGEELLKLGVRDKQVGEILNRLLTSVMADEIENTKSELEEKAQNILGGGF